MTNSLFISARSTIDGSLKTALKISAFVLLLMVSFNGKAQTTRTIPVGSFIVNMGVTPQTVGNGLKPYGLLYDLLENYQTPVIWAINPNKTTKDETDFIEGLVEYKSGAFIIEERYRTDEVNARIAYWQSQGVVGATTTTAVDVPVYITFKYAPYWVLDKDKGSIAAKFFVAAGIPASAHGGALSSGWKDPKDLNACDDLFVLPHADPTWEVHENLLTYVDSLNGNIWSGCHAASALENMVNPADRTIQTNFLTQKNPSLTLLGTGSYANSNSLILWTAHDNGSQPFTNQLFSDPVAQFMETSDAAQDGGSEQIYVPRQDGIARWNPGAKIITYDPTHDDVSTLNNDLSNAAAVNVYGRAFDSQDHGYVFYQGGHDISGNAPENVAAQRMFFNFSLFSLQNKLTSRLSVEISGTQPQMLINQPYQLNATATSAGIGLTYLWRSNYGTFSDSTIANPIFTPNIVNENASITCIVADLECQRSSIFETYSASVEPTPTITSGPEVTLTEICQNETSPVDSFNISGTNLNANVSITAPDGFQVSLTSNSGYAQTITVPYDVTSGTLSSTQIYVKLSSTASSGVATGVVSVTYLQGDFGTVTVTATVKPAPIITTTSNSVCVSSTLDLDTDDIGGTWSTASSTIATIDATGVVTAIAEGSVTITYTSLNGCSDSKVITVNPLPYVLSVTDASRAGTGSVTLSATPSLDNVNPSNDITINWYLYPDDITPLATATTTFNTGVISATTNYHVEAIDTATGCVSAERSKVVAIVSGTIDPGDITSAQSFCGPGDPDILVSLGGEDGDAMIDPPSPISYQWYISTDSLNYVKIDGATDTTYDPGLISVTTWFKREASAVVGVNLSSDTSNPIKITINPVVDVPEITATSTTTFCLGGSVELTAATSTASVTYQWSRNGANINEADLSTFTADSSGSYSVKVTDITNGCSATSSPSLIVTVNPLPALPTIEWREGDTTTFCKGDSIVLSSSEVATAYRWYEGSGTTPLNTDITSSSITITTSGTYKLEIENEYGCLREAASSVVVKVNELPTTPLIDSSGSLSFCPSDSVELTAPSSASYEWYLNGSIISGATSQTYVAKASGSYSIVVTDVNGCSSETVTPTEVTLYNAPPTPVISASGSTTFCKGDSLILSSSGSGTFQWFKDGVTINDSTRSELVVDSAGTYTVQVTSDNGCLSEVSSGTTIITNDIPSFTVAITVCKGKVIKLNGSATAATVDPWMSSDPTIGSIDSDGNLTANDKGTIIITYTNSNGCSISREIDINVAPATPDSITGPGLVTPGSTILFSVPPISGSTQYAWSFPSGWTASTSDNIATAQPNGQSGNVAVVASENGCTSDTVLFLVTIDSTDTDKDGIYDLLDLDNDNDGILDQVEFDACDPSSVDCDTDGDGTPNRYDLDSDGDGITDVYEANGTDEDKDGIADGPVDGDGVPESANGGLAPPDTDNDGKLDPYDVDSDGDGIPDSTEAGPDPLTPKDTDGDGIPDFRELDSDDDGIPDSTEVGDDPTSPRDTDGDGYPDYNDIDSDNDGITDDVENGEGPSELDTDEDGIPDYLDLDSDGDGITDVVEADGTDADKDGRADDESDSKGVPSSANGGLTPPDTDGDTKRDFQDVESDGDGIPDNVEGQGKYYSISGLDTDGDGLDDAYENDGGNYISPVDTDGDDEPDYRDLDSDDDSIPDSVEKGPNDDSPSNTDGVDNPDYRDLDSDNDSIPDSVEAIDPVSGNTDPTNPVDTDGDNLPDYRDLDSENDTIPDEDEAGPNPSVPQNTDGTDHPDFRDEDSNNNGIPDGETLLIWKKASAVTKYSSMGEMEVTFTIILTNQRPEPITDVQIRENLNVTFPSPITFRLGNVVSNGVLIPSSGFNGTTNTNMLQSGITLEGYQQDSIMFTVIFNPGSYSGDIRNLAEGTAITKWWPVTRNSIDIVNSNGRKHGPGDPTESPIPFIDYMLPDVITPNGDGYNDKLVIQHPAGVKVNLVVFNRWGQKVYSSSDYQNNWDGKITKGSSSTDLVTGTYYYIVEFTGDSIVGKTVKKSYLTIKRNF